MKEKINYLDGIRGICCVWVLVAHCMIWSGFYSVPQYQWFFIHPKIAVDIFMLLSGYLMVLVWDGNVKSFYLKRFLRIAPLYYFAVLLVVLLKDYYRPAHLWVVLEFFKYWSGWDSSYTIAHKIDFTNIFLHLSFLYGLFPKYGNSLVLYEWSIASEIQFYVLFPLIYWGLRKSNYWSAIALTVLALIVRPVWGTPEPTLFFLKAPQYLIGMLLAMGLHRQFKPYRAYTFALILAASQFQYSYQSLFLIAISLLLIAARTWQKKADLANKFLGVKTMTFLADTSYGVYLFHSFFLLFWIRSLYPLSWFSPVPILVKVCVILLLTSACVYPTAWVLYRNLEKPFIRMGRASNSDRSHRYIGKFSQ